LLIVCDLQITKKHHMNKTLLFLFVVLFAVGCSSKKKMSHAELMKGSPGWVNQTPNQPNYYHGVGMSVKSGQHDFRERARQNALSELASGISVNISATSVLNQFEIDRASSEFFRDNIRMSTQQYLEGYELVENWENDHQYWVYYRLSKVRFAQIKQDRINAAMGLSRSKFDHARELGNQGRVNDALGFYIRSVEDIKDFLGEDIRAEIDGEQKAYPTYLMAGLMDQLQALSFDFQMESYRVKPGPTSIPAPIEVYVRDESNRPVSGIPVIVRYSWLPGASIEVMTDARGRFMITPQGIGPGRKNEQISCFIDMRKVTANSTNDLTVQRLFASFNANTFVLPVEVIPPVCYVLVSGKDGRFDLSPAYEELNRLFTQNGFDLTSNRELADYILSSELITLNQSQIGQRHTHTLRATFVLTDAQGRIQYSARADDITGLGTNSAQALEDAMQSLQGKFRINLFPPMVNNVFLKNP
jgi:hypothetical protein